MRMFEARFQNFDDRSERAAAPARVAALRAELRRRGLDGFIVPHADRYQNEYLPACEERLAWLTGFSGSAGVAVVLADRAVLFVDGRYTLQAREQVDPAAFAIEHLVERPPETWIEANLAAGTKLGYDPWLHTIAGAEKLAKACEAAGATLVPVDLRFAGEEASAKLARVAAEVAQARADTLVISDPHAVAWAFNIRGSDVAHTPVALAFALVPVEGEARLYIDESKLTDAAKAALT